LRRLEKKILFLLCEEICLSSKYLSSHNKNNIFFSSLLNPTQHYPISSKRSKTTLTF